MVALSERRGQSVPTKVSVNGRRVINSKSSPNGARVGNGNAAPKFKTSSRKARAKKMVTEMYYGEPYTYYPLGEFIVADPATCRGRPTFKYTRIEPMDVLVLVGAGWTIERIAGEWWGGRVTIEAMREAVRLAAETWQAALADAYRTL